MGRGPVAGWRETWLHQTCSLAVFAWPETHNDRRRQIQAYTHRHTHTHSTPRRKIAKPLALELSPWMSLKMGKMHRIGRKSLFRLTEEPFRPCGGFNLEHLTFLRFSWATPLRNDEGKNQEKKWMESGLATQEPPLRGAQNRGMEGGMETTKLWLRKSYWYLRVKLRERKIAQAWDGEKENAGGRSLFSEQEDQRQTCGGWKTTWER